VSAATALAEAKRGRVCAENSFGASRALNGHAMAHVLTHWRDALRCTALFLVSRRVLPAQRLLYDIGGQRFALVSLRRWTFKGEYKMTRSTSDLSRLAVAAAFALGFAGSVLAQENNSGGLEEIVVTAEKRADPVQDTPISITAVSGADIAARGLTDFNSLAVSVPGLSMRTSGPGQTEFEMRGLNSSGGNTSMVGFYLDETPLSSPASAQVGKVVIDPNLYDLDRVEVLRGPQGTLYGSSSMGGTVKLVPNMPKLGDFDASGETVASDTNSGGNINVAVNGMVNIPIGSSAALRVVGSSSHDSGWISRNVIADRAVVADNGPGFPDVSRPGNFYTAPLAVSYPGVNTTDIDSVRATLLWEPIEHLSITPAVMYQRTQQGGSNTVDVAGLSQDPSVPPVLAHWEIYDTPEPQTDRFTLGSLKMEYQFQSFSITSATANWNRHLLVSQDGTEENASALTPGDPYDAAAGGIGPAGPNPYGPGISERDYTQQLTEELRVTSTGSGPFKWLVGYFYQDLSSEWSMYSLNPQFTDNTNIYVDFQPQTIIQNAFFGDFTYNITQNFAANVGLRHYAYNLDQTNEEFGVFTVYGGAGLGNSKPYYSSASQRAQGTDPKFNLSWKVTPDLLLYGTVAKGFRLGGANQPIPVTYYGVPGANPVLAGNECGLQQKLLLIPATACSSSILLQAPTTFASDWVWNYEVGEKAEFFDHQVQLNTSVYFEKWANPQVATNLAGFGITVNGSDAHIIGAESELVTLLPAGFQLAANGGYTHAQFQDDSAITGFPSGLAIPDTPRWTGAMVLSNRQVLADNLEAVGSAEVSYVGSRTDAPYGVTISLINVNESLIHLPAYELLNLRYGLRGDHWSATAFVTNVFDKIFLLDPQPQINLQTQAFTRYTVNQPRTFGLDFTYRYGGGH
jgi:iron complex outermembrane recepter protein